MVGNALLAALVVLLIDVLFEGWVQQLFGDPGPLDSQGYATTLFPLWPKLLKSGLFLAVLAITVVKVAIDGRWRDFTTKTELALVALAAVMVVSGLLGGSSPVLIGQALFVYFRGVIVFFAWRALRPTKRQIKPVLLVAGGVAVVNAAIAIVEFAVGRPAFQALGWTDLRWAQLARAHALFNHPNHLGHFLMVVELGLLCWFVTMPRVPKKMWLLFGFLALGMSASQSRESAIGFALGAAVVWWLRRRSVKPVLVALVLVLGFAGMQVLIPKNQATVSDRLAGVFNAISGGKPGAAGKDDPGASKQEIRIVFFKQGAVLLASRPLFGYGVGQFGGTVAFQHDPLWYQKFNFALMHSSADQVDSFWLHLVVETGALGLLAYLIWLWTLISPIVRSKIRDSPLAFWAPAVLVASVLIAVLSPALEDQLYPVLMFTVLGWAWTYRSGTNGVLPDCRTMWQSGAWRAGFQGGDGVVRTLDSEDRAGRYGSLGDC
jgi:hypothetical protein